MKSKIHEYKNKYLMISKIILILLTIFFITISSFAQQGINYKALIKDANGNVLANANNITVQFTIYEGADLIYEVYYESRPNVSTDANGILIINIGEGITNYDFSDISWGNDEHWLNVQIDIGDGLVDMGTTQFMAVPYALSAGNVSGLEKITENGNTGWRLKGRDSEFYGLIGNQAVDLSNSVNESIYYGATGSVSTALGYATRVFGPNSTAIGNNTFASAENSLAIGWLNEDVPNAILMVGNGFFDGNFTNSNALTVLTDGTITAPSFDLSEIIDDKALITKEYLEAYTTEAASGLEQITENGNTGWRLIGATPYTYGTIGEDAVDLSTSIFNSNVNGATGRYSTAIGFDTKAPSYGETVIGTSNTSYTPSGINNWASLDRLFVIGNGSDGFTSNALIVLKNGTITAPSLSKPEINTAGDKALITKEYADSEYLNVDGNITTGGSLTIQNASDATSTWRLETRPNGSLSMYRNGSYRCFFSESTGNYSSISDRRTKKDIIALENGTLNKVMQLNPVSYLMKEQKDTKRNLGLISQEVKEIFPSITTYVEESDLITLSYTELIPILIKALQEQQTIIDGQNKQIETITADNSLLKSKDIIQDKSIESLVTRLNLIEAKSSN